MYNVIGDVIMAYNTIFETKPKKENKNNFCKRVCGMLNEIQILDDSSIILSGKKMLNYLFKYSPFNTGYIDTDDILKEANVNYHNIFDLCSRSDCNILINEILSNIEIIVNCFYNFDSNDFVHLYKKTKTLKEIELMINAINSFLLSNGYKLVENDSRMSIVENEIAIDIEEIDDDKLKNDIISFYNYKTADDIEEKKKIILILIGKLESRKNEISEKFGSKIADMVGNYANNLNLRHISINESYKKCYNKTIAALGEDELVNWYNYIFAFMINIYLNLDKVKNININNGYK